MKNILRALSFVFFISMIIGCSNEHPGIVELEESLKQFNEALINPDAERLGMLVSDSLSYGHSSGIVENKAQFIQSLVDGSSNFLSIEIEEQKITMLKNLALVRHILHAQTHDKNKEEANISLKILLVWERVGTKWVLVARQSVRV